MSRNCRTRRIRFRLGRLAIDFIIIRCRNLMPATLVKTTEFDDTGVIGYRINASVLYTDNTNTPREIPFETFDADSEQDAVDMMTDELSKILIPAQLLHNVLTDSE